MSLYVHIAINEKTIRTFGAQNITPKNIGLQNKDDICSYRLCKYIETSPGISKRVYLSGVIYHNRKDGALALTKKIIDYVIAMGES